MIAISVTKRKKYSWQKWITFGNYIFFKSDYRYIINKDDKKYGQL